MLSTASGAETLPGPVFEGWNIGAVSVKRVRLHQDNRKETNIRRHGGGPAQVIREMLNGDGPPPAGGVMTGSQAVSFLSLRYLPESICIEIALDHLDLHPDLVVCLGGETFVVYCMSDGKVRRVISSNRCAAGSGEFLVQQFQRMNMDVESGIAAARHGQAVPLASRCSVHCKSDATHKLNKGECKPADIARSLIAGLAVKIAALIHTTGWRRRHILLAGGLAQSVQLVSDLASLVGDARFEVAPESTCLEAVGAAVAARNDAASTLPNLEELLVPADLTRFRRREPLGRFAGRVVRLTNSDSIPPSDGMQLILGVDAGSTTTKAILLDLQTRRIAAKCYLRTHGDPVHATFQCIAELKRQVAGAAHRVLQAAVTGSGRELVSISLGNCTIFNELLAHARAAREIAPDADTIFEIGGQDAKFIALQAGMPVDYSMNDGCSAGTGSFLEEAATADMQVPVEQFGRLALSSSAPVAFGERCAAFINLEVRAALAQGVPREDVLAGLMYAIVENYLSRVVGPRQIGRTVVLQGGVALNPATALAVVAAAGVNVTVPADPELMGSKGAALMMADLLGNGSVDAWQRDLSALGDLRIETKTPFTCVACENRCQVQRFRLDDSTLAFGGLCSKWEMVRRPKTLRRAEGRDLVALREELMFQSFAPPSRHFANGRIGLPLALTTYELYPLYSRLLVGLGFQVVLSRRGLGSRRTAAPMCYPAELMHAAVDDLLAQGVDFIFLPYLREFPAGENEVHGYLCPVTLDIPGVIRTFFAPAACKFLTPEIGLAPHLAAVTRLEIARMGAMLGVSEEQSVNSWNAAVKHQAAFECAYREEIDGALCGLNEPAVILAGRPYVAFAPEGNLSVARKIASRGFTVIPGDAVPLASPPGGRNVWHYTQDVMAAARYASSHDGRYVCHLSCFSCGPDAIIQHRLRRQLEGRPSCFLEIDSHTAHAGIETRIGAFLDIVGSSRNGATSRRTAKRVTPARLEQQGDRTWIVTGGGRRLALDAPEVVHVTLADGPQLVSELLTGFYASLGWRVVFSPNTSAETLQYAKRVCSGRECLPFLSMTGKAVKHLETRPRGEVTVFHLMEQEGPCQIGGWYDAAPMIFERLGEPDAVVAWPNAKNNYLGKGDRMGAMRVAAWLLSDVVAEMRSALRCLAKDRGAALALLGGLESQLIAACRDGLVATERELRQAAQHLAKVALREPVECSPRVLLFGGVSRLFVDGPVKEFFEQRGVLTKTTEMSEFICFMQAEDIVRLGFSQGYLAPGDQCSMPVLLTELVSAGDRASAIRALTARARIGFVEMLDQRWRRIAAASGLLFSPYVPFSEIERQGHQRISLNGYTEAPVTIGRYAALLAAGAFDGYVNIGTFNCAPANSASAVIHALSLETDTPYAVIESDGDCLTSGQLQQLEMVAVQCRRRREALHGAVPA